MAIRAPKAHGGDRASHMPSGHGRQLREVASILQAGLQGRSPREVDEENASFLEGTCGTSKYVVDSEIAEVQGVPSERAADLPFPWDPDCKMTPGSTPR